MAIRNGKPRIGTTTGSHVRSRQSGEVTAGSNAKPVIPIAQAAGTQFDTGPKLTNDRVRSAYSGPSGPTAGAYLRGGTVSGSQRISSSSNAPGRPTNPRTGRRAGVGGQTPIPKGISGRGPKLRTTRKTKRTRRV